MLNLFSMAILVSITISSITAISVITLEYGLLAGASSLFGLYVFCMGFCKAFGR